MEYSWNWHGRYNYITQTNNGIGIRIKDSFQTNLLLPQPFKRYWRDSNNLNSYLFFQKNTSTYGLYLNSWYLGDEQSGVHLNSGNSSVGLKSEQNWSPKLLVKPYLGYQREEDRGIIDYGWDLGFEGNLIEYRLGDYETSLDVLSEFDIFPHRRNSYHKVTTDISTYFSSFTYDFLEVGFMADNKQYYGPVNREIIDLSINNIFLDNYFRYSSSNKSEFSIRTILRERNLNDNNINQRNITYFENRFDYDIFLRSLTFRLGMYTHQESQDNTGLSTDSKIRQTSFASSADYMIGLYDQLEFDLYYIKFQYDTPDSLINHNDRDEQRYIGTVRYHHRFSPLLSFMAETSFDLYHHMYIFKEMSANNNWNRILRFSSSLVYKYHDFENRFRSGVLANYTVYDYQDLLLNKQSYVFRKYFITDSLYIPLNRNLYFCVYGTLQLEDRGTFYADQFAQFISHETRNIYCDLFMREKFGRWFNFDIGVLYYKREDFASRPLKHRIWKEYSYTPFVRLLYPLGRHVRFVSSIYYRIWNRIGYVQSAYTRGNVNLYYYF